jgi:hypothetical protein
MCGEEEDTKDVITIQVSNAAQDHSRVFGYKVTSSGQRDLDHEIDIRGP